MACPYGNTVHVVGIAGTEGASVLSYLNRKYPRLNLVAHNSGPREQFLKFFTTAHLALGRAQALETGKALLELEGVDYCFENDYLKGIEQADTLFVPQSWYLYPDNAPLKEHRDKFRSITRLYFDLFPGKIIGVTGSNGKTTTSNLIAEIMKRAYPSTLFSGNDRRAEQVLEQLEEASPNDWLVLEISNRQLMIDLGKSPDISLITNITPNHLTEHESFAHYAQTKASLLQYQEEDQWSVLNQDDPESRRLIEIDGGETMPFSTEDVLPKGVFVRFGKIVIKHADREEEVMEIADFPLLGKHNLSNALAASAACYLADVPLEIIAQTLRSVEPIPQRMEPIGEVEGVRFFNDSASTVPESTGAAVEAISTVADKLILIAGGNSKGSDYSPLADRVGKDIEHLVLLESPVQQELQDLLTEEQRDRVSVVKDLREAVQLAFQKAASGDAIALSPAAEFFVYFRDKINDAKHFRHLVTALRESKD